ncbi:hypothetical protein ACSLBF_00885 [Pseudoalteromonas sp. T1lg65]|uniref:hypothetical protein n=1 Tax=Pseudoalteromonas sp. T1lg65 TaxID=2077101 RepID=UPI003F7A3012
MKIKALLLALALVFLSACNMTYVPPVENYKLPQGAKIALKVTTRDELQHTHYGTTIFNNFNKSYDFKWAMNDELRDQLKSSLEAATKLSVVDYETIQPVDNIGFVSVKDKQWRYTPEKASAKDALLAENIAVVIHIEEQPTRAEMICSNYGCTDFFSQGHGLYTRSFMGLDNYYASASYVISAEIISQPIDLAMLEKVQLLTSLQGRLIQLEDYQDPEDHQQLSETHFLPVKAALLDYMNKLGVVLGDYINGNFSK